MERVLRSVLQVGNQPDADDCYHNWLKLQDYTLEHDTEEDDKIFQYLKTFYDQMSAAPDFNLVKEFFEKEDNVAVVSRLEEIKAAQAYIRTNFLAIVKSIQDRQQIRGFVLLMREACAVAEHGRNLDKPIAGKKVLRGVSDAMSLITDKLPNFTRIEAGERLEGVVHDDAAEVLEEYENVSKNNSFADRNLLGLEPVDLACKGHRKGEFWVHAAFPGELKTTLALNYAYNNAVVYKKNIMYCILEMSYVQLRKQLYAIHSSHGKFVTEWNKIDGYVGLDYRQIRDGELSETNFERLKIIAQDFKETTQGHLYIWRPTEEVTTDDIKRKAESFHHKYGCDGLIIDHMGLVKPKSRSTDYVVQLNSIVRETRLMALNFARGNSVPIFALFQINRQGKARAEKNGGRYDMAALSYANEVEKSADRITFTWLDDNLRRDGKFMLGCIKNRDDAVFEPMIGKILWASKRMRHLESGLLDLNDVELLKANSAISDMSFDDMMGATGTYG